jgi:hypothetical protein
MRPALVSSVLRNLQAKGDEDETLDPVYPRTPLAQWPHPAGNKRHVIILPLALDGVGEGDQGWLADALRQRLLG